LVIGFASGEIQTVAANLPLLKGSSIVGVFWGRFTEREPELNRRNTIELLEMHSTGQLMPCISDEFALQDAAAALQTLAERRAMGKVIVKIT
jgi:NADPH2:quinone reductase